MSKILTADIVREELEKDGIIFGLQDEDAWEVLNKEYSGTLDVKNGFLSTIAAFFSISGGASVGIYGPLVHFGGTLAAFLRRITFIPNIPHNVIIGAGVAAAISAGFGSPIAGIIFAHEVILRYFSIKALTAISLASVSASFLAQWLNIVEAMIIHRRSNDQASSKQ